MACKTLDKAKKQKNDEFYTVYDYIQKEINAYLEYNPNTFKDKTVLLPCDDPEWSNFTRFFAQNFEKLGLKKLISTSYAVDSKPSGSFYQPTLFETNDIQFDEYKTRKKGKIFTLTRKNKKVDINDLKWKYMDGDGDFRSDEVKKLRDEADIIVTNPPFSLFIEFVLWAVEKDKKLLIIGNQNAITYKEIFPLLKDNKLWIGATNNGKDMVFKVPEGSKIDPRDQEKAAKLGYVGNYTRLGNACWFTNLEHGRRHQPLQLMTMDDNKKFSKHKEVVENGYIKYDNYDAIEVKYIDAIPSDYNGIMGVPITFMDKYNPEQFEILGILQSSTDEQAGIPNLRFYNDFKEMTQDMKFTGSSGGKANGNPVLKGKSKKGNFLFNQETNEYVHSVYARIVIRKK